MQLRDIVHAKVITIEGSEAVTQAAKRMKEANVGCIVVTGSAVMGIITDRDLTVRCLAEGHDSRTCTVSQHMTSPAIVVSPTLDVLDTAHLMTERKVKRLPMVEAGHLVGLVSFSDIAQAMDRPLHDLMIGMGAARRAA